MRSLLSRLLDGGSPGETWCVDEANLLSANFQRYFLREDGCRRVILRAAKLVHWQCGPTGKRIDERTLAGLKYM